MTADHHPAREPEDDVSQAQILADRMATLLESHEPGWRLPRQSALARRFNVGVAEINAAITELTTRHLLRRLPDGHVYRASPAEYHLSLDGVPGLGARIDPMGGELACENRYVSWRRVPEDVGWTLGIGAGDRVCVVRQVWTAGGERAAVSTTYLPERLAAKVPALSVLPTPAVPSQPGRASGASRPGQPSAQPGLPDGPLSLPALLNGMPVPQDPDLLLRDRAGGGSADETRKAQPEALAGQPQSLYLEMQCPPPSAARILRLAHGQPAVLVSVRFDDPSLGTPVALTVGAFRPDLFRIVVTAAATPLPDGDQGSSVGAWTHVADG